MRVTTYAYPWDLARTGVEASLSQMVEEGLQGVSLASTYHPIDALSPRQGTARFFTDPWGAVHFPARVERYARIRPSTSSDEITAVWPEVAERAPRVGLSVTAWTVTTFQPWIVDVYPDTARVLPSGDPVGSGVCPANDDVREYLATLCADMVDQFDVDRVHLEGILQPAVDFDWLRPRVLVPAPPLAKELLGLCFCATCTSRGASAGLDVDRLRRVVTDGISALLIADPARDTNGGEAIAVSEDEELRAFAVQHERAGVELTREVAAHVAADGRTQVSSTAWTPFASLLGAAEDELLGELAATITGIAAFPNYFTERNRRIAELGAAAGRAFGVQSVITRVRPSETEARGGVESLAARVWRDAADLGPDEVAIYNYGLHPERDVAKMVHALRTATSTGRGRD